jgi:hypothetical protein
VSGLPITHDSDGWHVNPEATPEEVESHILRALAAELDDINARAHVAREAAKAVTIGLLNALACDTEENPHVHD